MDKNLNMKSAMAIAFLFLAVSYSFVLIHRIFTFIIQSKMRNGFFILSNLLNILVVLVILIILYKKIAGNDLTSMKNILMSSPIRVTAGFLIMITTVIGLFDGIPTLVFLIYNHYKYIPDSSLPYYQQYIISFRDNITSSVIYYLLKIAEFLVGYYLIYKYKNKQSSTPEAEEAVI